MRVILIRDPGHPGRAPALAATLKAQGLETTVVDANDANALAPGDRAPVDDATRRWLAERPLSDRAVARWLGHRRALIELVLNGPGAALILEDTIVPAPTLAQAARALAQAGDDGHDRIVLLGEAGTVPAQAPRPLAVAPFALARLNPLVGGDLPVVSGYAITRRAAVRFLTNTPRLVRPFDQALARPWATAVPVFALTPPVLEPAPEPAAPPEPTTPPYTEATALKWRLARLLNQGLDRLRRRLGQPPDGEASGKGGA
ncbi:glycosyltransferase family 25 protein [Pararhodospirillum oryzae]|uniref:Glycosyl transferase n=1 Tax=Pararhodospirillum oryzae TaxID=478448 RepID=A0A512H698_9PROT|nr:hypothetical protein [Pararhodospirillum oryzae]GEO80973.1 hypothetical protein ROR02_11040 [Pararhodospirillum oryzae]